MAIDLAGLPWPGPNNTRDVDEFMEALEQAIEVRLSLISGGSELNFSVVADPTYPGLYIITVV